MVGLDLEEREATTWSGARISFDRLAGTNGAAELPILREALSRNSEAVGRQVGGWAVRAFAIRQLYVAKAAIDLGSGKASLRNLRYAVAASLDDRLFKRQARPGIREAGCHELTA